MLTRLIPPIIAALVVAIAAVSAPSAPAPATAPETNAEPSAGGTFTVDIVHSTLNYRIRHFGVSYFHGRINMPSGTFRIDDTDLAGSSIHIVAEIKNMDAGTDTRDRFLMSPDFFNVREFPTAEFHSTSITKGDDGLYQATGDFTMHGVTKPITAPVSEFTTLQTDRFGFRGGFECTFTVKRSDFGMNLFVEEGTLGDEVTITAAIEGVQRPE